MSHPVAAAQRAAPRIRVGIGGWTYAPWRNNFYPEKLVQRRELEYASRQLRAIEINGTFYGAQKPATYAKWAAETPAGFVFSLKAPRYITEGRRLADTGKGVSGFVHGGLAEMGDRLGPILWQLPPSRPFDADDLGAFLDILPRELDGQPLRHVLEVRHPSFLDASIRGTGAQPPHPHRLHRFTKVPVAGRPHRRFQLRQAHAQRGRHPHRLRAG